MRVKSATLIATMFLAGIAVSACRDGRPGHWGDRPPHHHDGGGYGDHDHYR